MTAESAGLWKRQNLYFQGIKQKSLQQNEHLRQSFLTADTQKTSDPVIFAVLIPLF